MKWYLKDGTPIDIDTEKPDWEVEMRKVEKLLGDPKYKIIKQEELPDGKFVSTVWLGLDHSFSFEENHKPIIFETMVFPKKGEWGELDVDRYSTEQEALKGHREMARKWGNYGEKLSNKKM